MALTLSIQGTSLEFPLASLTLHREMGRPAAWSFVARVGDDSEAFAAQLLKGRCLVEPEWSRHRGQIMSSPALVTGANWKSDEGGQGVVEIETETTLAGQRVQGLGPFLPRRRVHNPKTMAELVTAFKDLAQPSERVQRKLDELKLPPNTYIVQESQSDWAFLSSVLAHCNILPRDEKARNESWLPLTMVGSVANDMAGLWLITSARKSGYPDWESRLSGEDDSQGWIADTTKFGSFSGEKRSIEFPSGSFPAVIRTFVKRITQLDKWRESTTVDLPLFTSDGGFIWRKEDQLSWDGQMNELNWVAKIFASAPEACAYGMGMNFLRPWIGFGKVKESPTTEPWITVALDGFETPNEVKARLLTPFSGKDGKKGLHFVPAEKTEVVLSWTGRYDHSLILEGNARSEKTDLDSPSVYLEALHKAHYEDVSIEQIGNIAVDSALSLSVQKRISINGNQPLQMRADGADLKLSGGIVYTGR